MVNKFLVFVNEKGEFGNPVGIVVDEKQSLSKNQRQEIAKNAGFSETVFINDSETGNISIFNPKAECAFAMHASIGVFWFINHILHKSVDHIESSNERIEAWEENGKVWISTPLKVLPEWNFEEYQSANEVEHIPAENIRTKEHTVAWAWMDKEKGLVRARTFAPDWGIEEDEANGSGSMLLTAQLQQDLNILHGKGSVIYTRYKSIDRVEVGGVVKSSIGYSEIFSSMRDKFFYLFLALSLFNVLLNGVVTFINLVLIGVLISLLQSKSKSGDYSTWKLIVGVGIAACTVLVGIYRLLK